MAALRTRRVGRAPLVLALVLALAVPVGWAGVSEAAAPPAPAAATSAVSEGVDYGSETFADPLDYSNVEDFDGTPMTASEHLNSVVSGIGIHNASIAGGIATMTADLNGWYDIYKTIPGSLPLQRDIADHRIDTNRYKRFQMRAYSDTAVTSVLTWFPCHDPVAACQGAQLINLQAGWHTYDVAIANTIATAPWTGTMEGMRILPDATNGVGSITFKLDWLRLAAAGTNVNVTIPQAAQAVWWDTDLNTANNVNVPGADQFAGAVGAGGTAVFPASSLAPGTYYVYYVSGGVPSDPVAITVAARPQPVVIDPDVAGGEDWATAVRGDAWDFQQGSDVSACNNCAVGVGSGIAAGESLGPYPSDPQLVLNQSGRTIDPNVYHRLTFGASYDGTFGLGFGAGGGMVARFLWTVPGQGTAETNDIVVHPHGPGNFETFSIDLKTNPPSAINDDDPAASKIGWAGPQSSLVDGTRFDPHEDIGMRHWQVNGIKLARNDRGTPHFTIRYKDNAWRPGTVADLFVDSDNVGFNGTKIAANVGMVNGQNTLDWNGTDYLGNPLPAGTYWVHVRMQDALGAAAQAYSTGPVDMPVQPANPPSAPLSPNAVAGVEAATVSWSPPASNGGAPVTSYVITVSPGNGKITVPAATLSTQVTGLTGGVPASFTIAAVNAGGTGPSSAATSPVTPTARAGTRFHPIVPYRVLDSRSPSGPWGANKLGANQSRDLQVANTGGAGGVPANASAVVLNITATNPSLPSFATLYPTGAVRPNPSNLNYAAGQTIPNLATVKIGSNGSVAFYNANGTVDFVADAVGYYDDGTSATGDLFNGITPVRLLDSRGPTGGWGGRIGPGAGNVKDLVVRGGSTGVPATATAVVLNVTATGSDAASFLRVWPKGAAQPITSNLNFAAGQTIPNLVVVQVGANDRLSFYNEVGNTHVVADVLAYFDPSAGGSFFHAMAPVRILDDRVSVGGYSSAWPATPPNPARPLVVAGANGIPAGATGVVMNTTVTNPSTGSFLQVYPDGVSPAPIATNLNFGPGQTIPNLVITQLAANGRVQISNQLGTVDVIGDVAGYYAST